VVAPAGLNAAGYKHELPKQERAEAGSHNSRVFRRHRGLAPEIRELPTITRKQRV